MFERKDKHACGVGLQATAAEVCHSQKWFKYVKNLTKYSLCRSWALRNAGCALIISVSLIPEPVLEALSQLLMTF